MWWLTSKQMGYALEAELDEVIEALERDKPEGRQMGRWISPPM